MGSVCSPQRTPQPLPPLTYPQNDLLLGVKGGERVKGEGNRGRGEGDRRRGERDGGQGRRGGGVGNETRLLVISEPILLLMERG